MSKGVVIVPIAVIILVLVSSVYSGFWSSHSDNQTLGYKFNNYNKFSFAGDVEDGDSMVIQDTVSQAEFDVEKNITKVWFESYKKRPILFKGDLTSNYFITEGTEILFLEEGGTTIQFNVTVVESHGIQYIEDFYTAKNSKEDVKK